MYPYYFIILFFSGFVLTIPASHAGDPLDTTGNAATVYRQALEVMPEITMDQAMWLLGRQKVDGRVLLTEESRSEFMKSLEPSIRLACRAAAMPQCDWGTLSKPGQGSRPGYQPYLSPLRRLACSILRRGEANWADDPNGYVADALVAMTMARHVETSETSMSLSNGVVVERCVVKSLAKHLPDLPEDALIVLATRWTSLPPAGDYCAAMRKKKEIFPAGFIEALRQELKKEEAARKQKAPANEARGPESSVPQEKSTAMVLHFFKEFFEREEEKVYTEKEYQEMAEIVHKMAAEVGRSLPELILETNADFDRWVEGMCLPAGEIELWHKGFEADHPNLNPISRLFVPKSLHIPRYIDTRALSHILPVAIQIILQGPDSVKHSVDPFGDGPYVYRETNGGFELQSKRKSVKLVVGEAQKP